MAMIAMLPHVLYDKANIHPFLSLPFSHLILINYHHFKSKRRWVLPLSNSSTNCVIKPGNHFDQFFLPPCTRKGKKTYQSTSLVSSLPPLILQSFYLFYPQFFCSWSYLDPFSLQIMIFSFSKAYLQKNRIPPLQSISGNSSRSGWLDLEHRSRITWSHTCMGGGERWARNGMSSSKQGGHQNEASCPW